MRQYEKNNKVYPSVTTIIHILGSDKLMQWANNMGFKRKSIKIILDESAEYGTIAHEKIRSIIDPYAPEPHNIQAKHLLKLNLLEKKFKEFIRESNLSVSKTEFEMVSEKLEYGGTMDAYGNFIYNNKIYNNMIIDFKTAKSIHNTMWLQLGGYYNLAKEKKIEVSGGAIIRLNEDKIRIDIISKDDLKKYSVAFLYIKKFYYLWKELNKDIE